MPRIWIRKKDVEIVSEVLLKGIEDATYKRRWIISRYLERLDNYIQANLREENAITPQPIDPKQDADAQADSMEAENEARNRREETAILNGEYPGH